MKNDGAFWLASFISTGSSWTKVVTGFYVSTEGTGLGFSGYQMAPEASGQSLALVRQTVGLLNSHAGYRYVKSESEPKKATVHGADMIGGKLDTGLKFIKVNKIETIRSQVTSQTGTGTPKSGHWRREHKRHYQDRRIVTIRKMPVNGGSASDKPTINVVLLANPILPERDRPN